jgi:hypothetical protein
MKGWGLELVIIESVLGKKEESTCFEESIWGHCWNAAGAISPDENNCWWWSLIQIALWITVITNFAAIKILKKLTRSADDMSHWASSTVQLAYFMADHQNLVHTMASIIVKLKKSSINLASLATQSTQGKMMLGKKFTVI